MTKKKRVARFLARQSHPWIQYIHTTDPPVEMGLSNDVMSQYAAACCQCASEIGLPYIDLYTEMIKHQVQFV